MNLDVSLDDLIRASKAARQEASLSDSLHVGGRSNSSLQNRSTSAIRGSSGASSAARKRRPPIVVRDPVTGDTRVVGENGSLRFGQGDVDSHSRFSKRRKPIVVRCPRTGATRIVGEASGRRTADRGVRPRPSQYSRTNRRRQDDVLNGQQASAFPYSHRLRPALGGVKRTHVMKKSSRSKAFGTGQLEPKIVITNLDTNVSNSDIYELFSTVGTLVRALIIYDKDCNHTGTAEVTFQTIDRALEAIKRYNGVPLDQRPLQITLATPSSATRAYET